MAREYRFRIDVFTPDTIPMARLAEYMGNLARMLGEPRAVHFVKLDAGSTVLVHKVDDAAVPKVVARAKSMRVGRPPADVAQAYRSINKMLRDDAAVGVLQEGSGAEIIRFPGREEEGTRIRGVTHRGSIDGEVIRVGGTQEYVAPINLRIEGVTITRVWAKWEIAKELGAHLREPVRLFGRGRWERDDDGDWQLDYFTVENYELLNDEPLSSLLNSLRTMGGDWGKGALDELYELRHGPEEKLRGGA
jgi:hypothetical protein